MTIDQIRKMIRLDPTSGRLEWLPRPNRAWSAKHAGQEAFTTIGSSGYRQGTILRKHYSAHRIVWALFYGRWPAHQIDHINGNRLDNRICNLRDATVAQNCANRRGRSGSSQFKGVTRLKDKWQASIKIGGRSFYLGLFTDEAEAAAAYDAALRLHGGAFAALNFPAQSEAVA